MVPSNRSHGAFSFTSNWDGKSQGITTMFKRYWMLYEADKGTGGAAEDDKGDNTGDATGQNSGQNSGDKPFAIFTNEKDFQDAIDKRLQERLERERKKSDEKARKAREDAEAAALVEQQKFQELAEKRAQKLTELESGNADLASQLEAEQGKAERYQKALTSLLEEQRKRVPDHLHSLLDKLDPVEQLEWIAGNGDKLNSHTGIPATPKPKTGMTDADREKAHKDAERYYRTKF